SAAAPPARRASPRASGCRPGSSSTRSGRSGGAARRESRSCWPPRTAPPILLAQEHDLRSVAFPAISTGIFGYPLGPATRVAVETVRAATAKPGSIRQVIFACFGSDVFMAYRDEGIAGQV